MCIQLFTTYIHILVPVRQKKLWHVYIHVYKIVPLFSDLSLFALFLDKKRLDFFIAQRTFFNVHDGAALRLEDVLPRLLNSRHLLRCLVPLSLGFWVGFYQPHENASALTRGIQRAREDIVDVYSVHQDQVCFCCCNPSRIFHIFGQ